MYNPSLRRQPRYEPAAVISVKQEFSLLDWLKATDRLIPREGPEKEIPLEEDEEISELMDGDSHLYDDDTNDLED
jgi:hypothetical protein